MEKTIQEETKESFENFIDDELIELLEKAEKGNDEESEEARQRITEMPLEVATGKDFNGTRTFMILLGTGGPAMRITGDLDEYDQPEQAVYQFQNWGTKWTSANATKKEEKILLDFARYFYFEE